MKTPWMEYIRADKYAMGTRFHAEGNQHANCIAALSDD